MDSELSVKQHVVKVSYRPKFVLLDSWSAPAFTIDALYKGL